VVSALSSSGQIAIRNDSFGPVKVTLDVSGYWLSQPATNGGTISDIIPKPTTILLAARDVAGVSGNADSTLTATLAPGAPVPAVGRVLVASPSPADPNGLLGTVTAVSQTTAGSVVTLIPATLDQAYSTFDVSTSQAVTDSDVEIISSQDATSAGQEQVAAASPISGTATAPGAAQFARLTAAPGIGYDLSNAEFTCQGSGGPAINLAADLSNMSVDLSLDANPAAPYINFLITADPVFTINVGFTGQLSCKLSDDGLLSIEIPIPGAPLLLVEISPVVTLNADGQASVNFVWKPRAAVGFVEGNGISTEVHAFGSSGTVGVSATADADLFLGFDADITLAGRVGVGGEFGPDLPVSYDSATGCLTVDGQLEASLVAEANVFVEDWSFTLATGTFDTTQLYVKCSAPAPPSGASHVTNLQAIVDCVYPGNFGCFYLSLDAGTTAPVTISWTLTYEGTLEDSGSLTLSGQTTYAFPNYVVVVDNPACGSSCSGADSYILTVTATGTDGEPTTTTVDDWGPS
jgi:hypothetical protein